MRLCNRQATQYAQGDFRNTGTQVASYFQRAQRNDVVIKLEDEHSERTGVSCLSSNARPRLVYKVHLSRTPGQPASGRSTSATCTMRAQRGIKGGERGRSLRNVLETQHAIKLPDTCSLCVDLRTGQYPAFQPCAPLVRTAKNARSTVLIVTRTQGQIVDGGNIEAVAHLCPAPSAEQRATRCGVTHL